jgi:hypothetical protein
MTFNYYSFSFEMIVHGLNPEEEQISSITIGFVQHLRATGLSTGKISLSCQLVTFRLSIKKNLCPWTHAWWHKPVNCLCAREVLDLLPHHINAALITGIQLKHHVLYRGAVDLEWDRRGMSWITVEMERQHFIVPSAIRWC